MNKKTIDASKTIMRTLVDLGVNHGEAINALMVGLVVSAQGVGLDKHSVTENLSQNWDLLSKRNFSVTH